MIRRLTDVDPMQFPEAFRALMECCPVYDSSCSPAARVWLIDCEEGYYLKAAPAGALAQEAAMTSYFHTLGLGAEVLGYIQDRQDWLLTRRLPGEDCLDRQYTDNPERLCDVTGELLRQLHELSPRDCPVNRRDQYIRTARENCRLERYDATLFPDNWGYASAAEAAQVMEEAADSLCCDTLIHGDYCLPNIILKDWKLSGFIDLDCAGLGDRHIDLFWGIWSLGFNLKTDKYRERFLDAYGRDRVNPELLNAIGAFEVFLG